MHFLCARCEAIWWYRLYLLVFFFFQAEDGIRDYKVTGVQTCALPISRERAYRSWTALQHSSLAAFRRRYLRTGRGHDRRHRPAGIRPVRGVVDRGRPLPARRGERDPAANTRARGQRPGGERVLRPGERVVVGLRGDRE